MAPPFRDDRVLVRSRRRETPDDRTPDEIRAEIERARDEVADSLIQLRDELNARLDWRWMVKRRPYTALATAFFAGVWLGWR